MTTSYLEYKGLFPDLIVENIRFTISKKFIYFLREPRDQRRTSVLATHNHQTTAPKNKTAIRAKIHPNLSQFHIVKPLNQS